MAMPAMIVLGDKTDHGGEVIEASGVTDTHNKRIARVGDKVYCPKKGHGTAIITTGDPTMIVDGKAVAYHGCKTSCGATLISAQSVITVSVGGGAAASSNASATVAVASAAASSQLIFEYDEQVQLAATPGVAWFIEASNGKTYSGTVGEDGLLPRVDTLREDEYTVYWGDEAMARAEGIA